jgi:hypothetical protein
MNLFGVLKYKKMAEDFIRDSGIPFTIIRLIYRKVVIHGLIMDMFCLTWCYLVAGQGD